MYLEGYLERTWEQTQSVLWSTLSKNLRVSQELIMTCIIKQDGSVSSGAIGSELESVPGLVVGSILRAEFGADRQADWECVIKCNWKYTGEDAWECG